MVTVISTHSGDYVEQGRCACQEARPCPCQKETRLKLYDMYTRECQINNTV